MKTFAIAAAAVVIATTNITIAGARHHDEVRVQTSSGLSVTFDRKVNPTQFTVSTPLISTRTFDLPMEVEEVVIDDAVRVTYSEPQSNSMFIWIEDPVTNIRVHGEKDKAIYTQHGMVGWKPEGSAWSFLLSNRGGEVWFTSVKERLYAIYNGGASSLELQELLGEEKYKLVNEESDPSFHDEAYIFALNGGNTIVYANREDVKWFTWIEDAGKWDHKKFHFGYPKTGTYENSFSCDAGTYEWDYSPRTGYLFFSLKQEHGEYIPFLRSPNHGWWYLSLVTDAVKAEFIELKDGSVMRYDATGSFGGIGNGPFYLVVNPNWVAWYFTNPEMQGLRFGEPD